MPATVLPTDLLSLLLINHTHKFNVLPTDLKTEAVHCRGQGQGQESSRPRPQNFVLELSSRSRPVLEDPIPGIVICYLCDYRRGTPHLMRNKWRDRTRVIVCSSHLCSCSYSPKHRPTSWPSCRLRSAIWPTGRPMFRTTRTL